MTYEAPGSIRVVKRICNMCTDLVLRYFDNMKGLNYQVLA
jgi:hypothetical protein